MVLSKTDNRQGPRTEEEARRANEQPPWRAGGVLHPRIPETSHRCRAEPQNFDLSTPPPFSLFFWFWSWCFVRSFPFFTSSGPLGGRATGCWVGVETPVSQMRDATFPAAEQARVPCVVVLPALLHCCIALSLCCCCCCCCIVLCLVYHMPRYRTGTSPKMSRRHGTRTESVAHTWRPRSFAPSFPAAAAQGPCRASARTLSLRGGFSLDTPRLSASCLMPHGDRRQG